jgi:DNA replication protein DnaC
MIESIEELLRKLHCNGMLENFQSIIETAKEKHDSWLQTLRQLLEVEVEYRKTRSLMYRLKLARLPQIKIIEHFDTNESPLNKNMLDELSECKYIKEAENIILVGGSGTGKSHIALSLAHIALQQGYKVKFYKFSELARKLLQAKEHRYEANLMAHLQRFNLLIIDEVGYLPIDKQAGSLLFELFSNMYEKVSLVLTTHLAFNEWGELFGNHKATKAIIDRLTHHCKILETGNVSWRLKERINQKINNNDERH